MMSGFNERVKSIERVRSLIRDFLLYGFKSREQISSMNARTYDDEKRRIENYLSDYINYIQTPRGKNVYLSIDSREVSNNPLYNVFKSKTFTNLDITLHFILFDILADENTAMGVEDMIAIIDEEYLSCFENPLVFDESSLRKKLKEYIELGIITAKKNGRKTVYQRTESESIDTFEDALTFFSETAPCGVIGSYMLDKIKTNERLFQFKHHHSLKAIDSEILYMLFEAMNGKKAVQLWICNERKKKETVKTVIPCFIMESVQNGREYLLAYDETNCFQTIRIDRIAKIEKKERCSEYDDIILKAKEFEKYIWTASTSDGKSPLGRVAFEVEIKKGEEYIVERLNREKRNGTVTQKDEHLWLYSVDVWSCEELIPWVRTFIGRLNWVYFSNEQVQKRFINDLYAMKRMYECMEDKNDI